MNELLKEYDERTKKSQFYLQVIKTLSWGAFAIIAAIYFGNMLFGQSSLDTLLSLQTTKKELIQRIEWLKKQNAEAQKEYFELKGLYPNEK